MKNWYSAWKTNKHLSTFSNYKKDLSVYRKYKNKFMYADMHEYIELIARDINSVGEIGVGGGEAFNRIKPLIDKVSKKKVEYTGYDISPQCISFLKNTYSEQFQMVDPSKEDYKDVDLVYMVDVAVHQENVLNF